MLRVYLLFLLLLSLLPQAANAQSVPAETELVRFATFNVSMFREQAGQLASELSGDEVLEQPQKIAEIIQRARPDVVLLNEFDYDRNGEAIAAFKKQYLEVAQNDQAPIDYPYMFAAPVNTGVDSEVDLDGDGKNWHSQRLLWVWTAPRAVRDGGAITVPDRSQSGPHLSDVSLERYAGKSDAGETWIPRTFLLRTGQQDLSPILKKSLGRPDQGQRSDHPPACRSSDPTGI